MVGNILACFSKESSKVLGIRAGQMGGGIVDSSLIIRGTGRESLRGLMGENMWGTLPRIENKAKA